MNSQHLKKLEYYEILEKLSTFCHTYVGKELAKTLLPSNNKEIVKETLKETEQAIRFNRAKWYSTYFRNCQYWFILKNT